MVAGAVKTGSAAFRNASTRAGRREDSGSSSSEPSPSASRSKPTKEAGVRSARVRTREAAGWIRSSSSSNRSRPSRAITISPSTTQRGGSASRKAVTSSGKYRVSGLPVRLPISTSSPSRKTIARKPSHLASYCIPGGISGTDLASIGATGGITGRSMSPMVPPPDPARTGTAALRARAPAPPPSVVGMAGAVELDVAGRTVRLSNPDKVYFPERGYTKLDVAQYYLAVAEGVLRGLRERPTTLQRFPDGVDGEFFYQKRAPKGLPDWLPTATINFPSGRSADEICPTEPAAVLWAANLGCLTFHPWPVRRADTEHPDELRIDLDPQPGTDFHDAVRAAHELRALLDGYGLQGWPKTPAGAACTSTSRWNRAGPSPTAGTP